MELFATGFNAWNQLTFTKGSPQEAIPEEPDDLFGFTKVLSATSIERPVSRLTYTIGTLYQITTYLIPHHTSLLRPIKDHYRLNLNNQTTN